MSYHFDCGDSNCGPVGVCFRVKAYSREEAVTLANRFLESAGPVNVRCGGEATQKAVEYCNVYFGYVTEAHIDDEEEVGTDERRYPLNRWNLDRKA